MSSMQASSVPPKKSFAQVAAAANISIISKEKPLTKTNEASNVQPVSRGANGLSIARPEPGPKLVVDESSNITSQLDTDSPKVAEVQLLNGLLQRAHLQDGPPRVLSSEYVFRKETDTKSVTSRTTLTLDEKESLRPDDSASVQAAAEEDAFSPSGSVVAGSREGSDPDARAFRDQLNAIDRTGATGLVPQQLPGAVVVPVLETRNGGIIYPAPPPASNPFSVADGARLEIPRVISGEMVNTPDEKLLEALASPKDRLFVLKIEQDMIDFVRDSQEEFLQLPQTNSFYRMLSHKLADYYMLGHIIDESMTSVRIFRTPHARLPPPLIGPASSADGSTPPPTAPARKIMRRMAEGLSHRSGEGRGNHSQTPSTAASDAGAGSGGDDGNEESSKKDKAALTREERENRYREARARIFKDFKEDAPEVADGANGGTEKEVSRSSSASGVKKGKKHRKPKDDGFEARSAYSQYGNQPFSPSGLNTPASDSTFYNPFAPYAMPDQNASVNHTHDLEQQMQGPGYSPYNQQPQQSMAPWGSPHPMQGYAMPPAQNVSNFQPQDSYDSNNVFGSAIQSFPSPNISSQLTPKVATQSMYSPEYMPPNDPMGWPNGNFNNPYPGSNMIYNSNALPEQGFMGGQGMYTSPPGPYGGFPTQDQQYYAQQGTQSAFNRLQFNPRSQPFTPLMRNGLGSQPTSQPQSFAYAPLSPQYANNLQRQVSNNSPASGYNSSYFQQPSPNGNRLNSQNQPRAQAQAARLPSSGFSNSIAKWGNPSTLPPKPPPPAIQSPFFEVPRDPQNQQPLPPNPYSNLVRPASNGNVGLQSSR